MDSTPRHTYACTACAKLKIKCDKKVPCSRCAARGAVCQSRHLRRPANFDGGNASRNNSHARNTDRQHLKIHSIDSAGPDKAGRIPFHRPSLSLDDQMRHGLNDCQNGPPKGSLTFVHDPGQQDMADLSSSRKADSLPLNPQAQPQPFVVDLGSMPQPHDPMQLSTNDSDLPPLNKFQDFSSSYIQNDLDFDMPMPYEHFFQTLYVDALTQAPQRPTSSSSMFGTNLYNLASNNMNPCLSNGAPNFSFSPIPRPRSKGASASPPNGTTEYEALLSSRRHWSSFRCVPEDTQSKCPKTARIYLEGLLQALSSHETQSPSPSTRNSDEIGLSSKSSAAVISISHYTRDKLLIYTQALLLKALEFHRSNPGTSTPDSASQIHHLRSDNEAFIILPPPKKLESYIRTCLCRFELSYPLIPAGELDMNELMQLSDPRPSTLLLLLMVALGSMTNEDPDMQYLASGLTEVCRISLFKTAEEHVDSQWDLCSLNASLLLTLLAAWNGDKWHMDVAIAQRGLNLSLLRQSRFLKNTKVDLAALERQTSREECWEAWKSQESKNRLVYSWVAVDLEISLFHDVPPAFSVNELSTALPQDDRLWQAHTASEWSSIREQAPHPLLTCSLSELFGSISQNTAPESHLLTSFHLRLLLYPIQSLVHNIRQFRTCMSLENNRRTVARPSSRSGIDARLGEARTLLLQWYNLHSSVIGKTANTMTNTNNNSNNQNNHDLTKTLNLILYHQICLDSMVCFRCIEQIGHTVLRRNSCGRHCIEDAEEVWIHSGQVIRLLRRISDLSRPAWYAAAVYRVSLICHANSLLFEDSAMLTPATTNPSYSSSLSNGSNGSGVSGGGIGIGVGVGGGGSDHGREIDNPSVFAIDSLLPDDSRLAEYQKYGEGTPVLRRKSGVFVPTSDAAGVLGVCMELLDNSDRTPFAVGIRDRLSHVGKRRTG